MKTLPDFEKFERDFIEWYLLVPWIEVEQWTRTRALYEYFKYLQEQDKNG
jgi:hypothetical protein